MLKKTKAHGQFIAPELTKPTNDSEYDALVATLNDLFDVAGDDESHP